MSKRDSNRKGWNRKGKRRSGSESRRKKKNSKLSVRNKRKTTLV